MGSVKKDDITNYSKGSCKKRCKSYGYDIIKALTDDPDEQGTCHEQN